MVSLFSFIIECYVSKFLEIIQGGDMKNKIIVIPSFHFLTHGVHGRDKFDLMTNLYVHSAFFFNVNFG